MEGANPLAPPDIQCHDCHRSADAKDCVPPGAPVLSLILANPGSLIGPSSKPAAVNYGWQQVGCPSAGCESGPSRRPTLQTFRSQSGSLQDWNPSQAIWGQGPRAPEAESRIKITIRKGNVKKLSAHLLNVATESRVPIVFIRLKAWKGGEFIENSSLVQSSIDFSHFGFPRDVR